MLDVAFRIIVEDYTRIEHPFGVENLFDSLHHFKSFIAPFIAHEGGHVSTRAMFCFQRTIVAIHNQLLHLFHQGGIALYFFVGMEVLIDDEVVIAFKGVAIDAGIVIAMACYELLQIRGSLREVLDVESHIFNEAGCTRLACTAYAGEDTGSDGPEGLILLGFISEMDGRIGGKSCQASGNLADMLLQFLLTVCFSLNQDSG